MSRTNAAKKARRKRRLAARNDRWLPDQVHADVLGVAAIADEVVSRGWEFDREYSTEDFVSWYFPPSAIDVDPDDESTEPITRIWVTDPAAPHVILVGADGGSSAAFTVEGLFERLDEIEAYRVGMPAPAW